LAEVLHVSMTCWNRMAATGADETEDKDYHRLQELGYQIELRINPAETDHRALVNDVRQMISAVARGIGAADDFGVAHERATELGQKIFKAEWNRVKEEIERP